MFVVFDVIQMSYHYQSVYVNLNQAMKIIFYVYQAFLFRRQGLLGSLGHLREVHRSWVLTELTRLMKESWMEPVLIKLTWLPKDFCNFLVLTKLLLVNTRNHFRVSFYRVGSTNEGFSYFGILSSIDLSIDYSWLWWWILIILSYIWANLTIWKI